MCSQNQEYKIFEIFWSIILSDVMSSLFDYSYNISSLVYIVKSMKSPGSHPFIFFCDSEVFP